MGGDLTVSSVYGKGLDVHGAATCPFGGSGLQEIHGGNALSGAGAPLVLVDHLRVIAARDSFL
jgi:hypothetical protein